jgi:glycosyltransferase involved in cell wall biosynthesis
VKLAFIVQRYGTEILGGSEYHCRLIAERLAQRHDVEVLTTCARDYVTWKNEYPEGTDRVRGVTVRRFANARTRDIDAFNRLRLDLPQRAHARGRDLVARAAGPVVPRAARLPHAHHQSYDALIFFTYLYAPTVLGLRIAPGRSILVPTAHDEPAIHLEIYREMFGLPAGIAYNTEVERRFLTTHFSVRAVAEETIGCGVDLPNADAREQAPHEEAAGRARRARHLGAPLRRLPAAGAAPHQARRDLPPPPPPARPVRPLRRPHRSRQGLRGADRVLQQLRRRGGDATLALMGVKLMKLPEEPFIRFAGLLSERERLEALEAATVVVVPSPYESLSLLALEAFAVGTPVLANARSEVLVEHCVKSNAGLYYADRDEFVEALTLLLADTRLRTAMGRNGREYVRKHYRWDAILTKYDRLLAQIRR